MLRNLMRWICALGLLMAVPSLARAEGTVTVPVWLGPAGTGTTETLARPVRTWKDMRFAGIVRQRTDFSCGAAALATVFNGAFGRHTSEQQVLVNMLKIADPAVVKEKGFSLLDMKNYVRAIGMTGEGYAVPYEALQQLRVPGIALMNIRGYKHFVVIRKASADRIQIGDPALGNRTIGRREFERSWNGVVFVVLGERHDPANALQNPPAPLSASRIYDRISPIPDANLYEFGILNTAFRF